MKGDSVKTTSEIDPNKEGNKIRKAVPSTRRLISPTQYILTINTKIRKMTKMINC